MLACVAALQIGLYAAHSIPPPVAQTVDSTPRPIKQFLHTRWTVQDGAPSETNSLAQTADGYLWIGTTTALIRFDGVRFVPMVLADTLRGAGTQSLLATRDGSLWILWGNGLVSRFREGRLATYGPGQGLLKGVFVLTESSAGVLIAGTANGLARFDNDRWTDVGPKWGFPGTQGREVWFDRDDALWVQTEDRVVYLPAGAPRFLDTGIRLLRRGQPADFAQTKDGTVWTAELSNSVHTVPRIGSSEPRSEVMVRSMSLLVDRKGSLWIGTYTHGLRRIVDPRVIRGRRVAQSGSEAEEFSVKDGLLSDVVSAMLEDNEGNIWVATPRGLERFRESAFISSPTSGSPRARIVFTTRDSTVWVAEHNVDGLFRHRGGATDTIKATFTPLSLFEDRSGGRWTVSDSGIHRLKGTRFERVKFRAPKNVQRFVDITADPAGTIWVYSDLVGLLRASGDSLISVAAVHDSVYPHARLFGDSKGRIWIAENRTVAVYENGRLRRFEQRDGVPGRVQAFFEDRAGNIWAAASGGLGKFAGNGFRKLGGIQRFPGRWALGIAEDHEGAWWVAIRNGVVRVPPGEAERALANPGRPLSYRTFDQFDGLPGLIYGGMYGPMAAATPDGKVWIATDGGLASVDPRTLPPAAAPSVLIETLRVDGRELSAFSDITISPGVHEFEIDYTTTSLSTPERHQFRYRLESQDTAWHDVGTRRRAYYTGLEPGSYRFRVTATSGDGLWNDSPAVLTFRVLPAWHQTIWFRAGVILIIGAFSAGAAVSIQRRRHLLAQAALKREYEATLTERTRIAQDLHDTLLQGFAGVTLQLKTAELALPEQPDVAAETIRRVQQLARASLREARERVWDMRRTEISDHDLPSALEAIARDRTTGTGPQISVLTTGERRRLLRSVEDTAIRIGREALVNALRHAEARRIEVHVEFGAANLRLKVSDDGRGFTLDEAEAARKRGHFGLTGVREQAESMGGRCDVRAAPAGGTVVEVELPLGEAIED